MCSSLLKMRIVPPPLTVVVLVSMKSVPPAHNSVQPPVPIVLENNRTLDASSLSSSSILYLHWPWFNIYKYHFIQLWRHFVKNKMRHIPLPVLTAAVDILPQYYQLEMFLTKYSSVLRKEGLSAIVQCSPKAGVLRDEIFWILWNWRLNCGISMLLYSRGIKEFTCNLTLDPNLLSIFTTAII